MGRKTWHSLPGVNRPPSWFLWAAAAVVALGAAVWVGYWTFYYVGSAEQALGARKEIQLLGPAFCIFAGAYLAARRAVSAEHPSDALLPLLLVAVSVAVWLAAEPR
jgi:drug/metabolite transporter (DMT)-like permease